MENKKIEVLEKEEQKEKDIIKNEEVKDSSKKKKKKILITGIIVILILLITIGITSFFLIKNIKNDKNENNNSNTITITFNSKGGSEVKEVTMKKDKELKLPETKKDGYTFMGWYKGSEKIEDNTKFNENTTLNARWEKEDNKKTFTIYFDTGGGTKIKPITQECGLPIFLDVEDPEKEFDWFIYWTNKKTGTKYSSGLILDCEDVTFEANWNPKSTSVVYYKKHTPTEDFIESQDYRCEKNMTLKLPDEAPKVDGYKFIKWIYEDYKEAKNGDKLPCSNYLRINALYEVDLGEIKKDPQPEPLEEEQNEINEPTENETN